ncbi:MAG: hypothetical protein QM756_11340 [Polyangiaceae bacterium]
MPTQLCVVFALSSWACRSVGGDANPASTAPKLARGDHVVVEPRAAEFFEGRVLSLGKAQLRVEPVGKHEGISVSLSDAYPLAQAGQKPQPKLGQFVICRLDERWLGCRVEALHGEEVEVRALDGVVARIAGAAWLTASPATELNLRRAFGKVSSSSAFASAAANAGRPQAPAGYHVLPRSRVVARRANGWFSGVVADVRDSGAHVVFAPDNVGEPIALGDIVPEPPSASAPGRGDFALVRPASPAEPWQTMRVVGTEERDFKVSGADSRSRVVPPRDLLPLVPAGR